jgi:hypothetical protein
MSKRFRGENDVKPHYRLIETRIARTIRDEKLHRCPSPSSSRSLILDFIQFFVSRETCIIVQGADYATSDTGRSATRLSMNDLNRAREFFGAIPSPHQEAPRDIKAVTRRHCPMMWFYRWP